MRNYGKGRETKAHACSRKKGSVKEYETILGRGVPKWVPPILHGIDVVHVYLYVVKWCV